jgi:hypothetical protein
MLDKAIAIIAESVPASETAVLKRLMIRGFRGGPRLLARIERAARYRPSPAPFAVLRKEDIAVVVARSQLSTARLINALAVRNAGEWGLTNVDYLAFQVGTEDREFVRAVVSARRDLQWLDKKLGWFWFQDRASVAIRAIERALSNVHARSLRELQRGALSGWPPEFVPPTAVLRALCRQCPNLKVSRSSVGLSGMEAPDSKVLALFKSLGPKIDRTGVFGMAEQLGLAAGTVLRILRSSSWVSEPQPGIFELVGAF